MNRRNFVRAVRVEIVKRAKRPDGQPACERCGAIGVRLEIHHKTMDAMVVDEDKSRQLTADEGELLCEPCHDPITASQRKILAETLAREASHLGADRRGTTFKSRNDLSRSRKNPRRERPPVPGPSAFMRQIRNTEG